MSVRTSDPMMAIDHRDPGAWNHRATGRQWFQPALLSLLVAIFLILYSGIGRPIWVDEFLQFAFGGFTNTSEAWAAITRSIAGTNHSQTGIYMILDFWLLKIFGASALALRLPSILSAAFLCYAALRFFEFRSISLLWEIVLLMAIASHETFVHFVGEARPYMPLAAAVVGILAFYAAPPELRRTTSNTVLGFASVLLGTFFHPYFPLYWISVLAFLYGLAMVEGKVARGLTAALEFANLRLITVGILVFATISELSWLPRRLSQSFDPFQWLHHDRFWVGFLAAHFSFLGNRILLSAAKGSMNSTLAIPAICLLGLATICTWRLFVDRHRRRQMLTLLPPLALVGLGLILSLLLSYVSILNHYWILDRQWIASMALVVIGVVWFLAEIARQLALKSKHAGTVLAILLVMYFMDTLHGLIQPRLTKIHDQVLLTGGAGKNRPGAEDLTKTLPTDAFAWVDLANENIATGGPVWPIFRKYYGD